MKYGHWIAVGAVALMGTLACDDKPAADAAPKSSALSEVKKPAAPSAQTFEVASDTAKVTFLMDAPIEKIYGDAPKSVAGDLHLDLEDVTKSQGLIKIDLDKLVIYQDKRKSEDEDFSGEKKKVDKQNEHARDWLQISEKVPEKDRKDFQFIQYKITKVETSGEKNITKLKGAERKLQLTVTGDFRLHGRKVVKKAELEVTVKFDGDTPKSMTVKSAKPIEVNLDEHDVGPRGDDPLGKVLDFSTQLLTKVNKKPQVSIEFEAKAKDKK